VQLLDIAAMKLFSNRHRPVHLGPYPLERLKRAPLPSRDDDAARPPRPHLSPPPGDGQIGASIDLYLKLFEQFRDGAVAAQKAPIELDPAAIAADLKAGGYFLDATMMGCCEIPDQAWYATGEEGAPFAPYHRYAVIVLVEDGRPVDPGTTGAAWVEDSQGVRNATRALEIANVLAGYIRNLGWPARSHSRDAGDVCHDRLVVRAGLGEVQKGLGESIDGEVTNPFIGTRFGTAIVTTELPVEPDRPLAARRGIDRGLGFWLGLGGAYPEIERRRERRRPSHMSRYPMERIARVARPTTLILDDEVPRISKRAAFFERALRGDLGEKTTKERTRFAVKHPFTFAMRTMQAAMVPIQDGEVAEDRAPGTDDPKRNAEAIKSLGHWIGADQVGICEAPDYTWFSHGEDGTPLEPAHKYAVVFVIDQGFETMEGASGDDWVSGSQSMRAYMRGAEMTGIVAEHIRRLGHRARAHTNIDSRVLHIPLTLLAGLGELSRIGELVLNPFLGPRFKTAIVTTDMPLEVDLPIDFGLQDMCGKCMKCARECPCDAISWGDKVMFNGYEIWKPDVERCARYRLTNKKGAACGRCMKTCPYNHEGLLYHRLFLWLAIKVPASRRWIAILDDRVGNGRRNLVKKWWRDLEWLPDGYAVEPLAGTNRRDLDVGKVLDPAKQKIAYYHADAMPVPDDTHPQPLDRKAALAAAAVVETPDQARARRARGEGPPSHYTARAPGPDGPTGPAVEAGMSGLAGPTTPPAPAKTGS